ncbi:hypothetical protein K504DRAFT_488839 [Pleomassaria siparia CBS 279.74]|uniref:Large ribosomal subunit protein mL50 n=1 Tax=Pleomassaria siparia CBS 279.74 TaxID=1314801 RepID=A0A6G1KHU6_9PLEO|nr:hypothetical protein K504DRAFT_488839 [Pleomassaria siparia CBS 279.74]
MRRIARPQRSIGNPISSSNQLRPRAFPSRCLNAPAIPASLAPFSTTSSPHFLHDRHDKKKHQAFVRRWQKRLLGDSEPIGAHVDPYDKTSPVRISPDEYGEEEEVLVDEDGNEISKDQSLEILYKKANSGFGLRVVGGKDMHSKLEEERMAAEFEILTMKTYTPLSLKMADEIEDLTGTPYTLSDENLMMAQTFQEVTGKPYTDFSFGRISQIKDVTQIRKNFQQALVEVYTLKEAGRDLDLTKLPNRGVYNPPHWISDVQTYTSPTGDLVLSYPEGRTAEKLLEKMQDVPAWDPAQVWGQSELVDEAEYNEPEQLEEPVQPEPTGPNKHAIALVDESKRFDFMSNLPTPRKKPQETAPKVDGSQQKVEAVAAETSSEAVSKPAVNLVELEAKLQASKAAIAKMRHIVIESGANSVGSRVAAIRQEVLEDATKSIQARIAAVRATVRDGITSLASESITTIVPEAKWRHASLADPTIKFALTKRLIQLTGIRISDPHLNSVQTVGDLYGQLCSASKPKPKKLYDTIRVEAEKKSVVTKTSPELTATRTKKKHSMGELLSIPNVSIRAKRLKSYHKHRQIGLDKVIKFALAERNLESQRRLKYPSKNAHSPHGSYKALAFGEIIQPNVLRGIERERESKEKALVERRDAYAAQNS